MIYNTVTLLRQTYVQDETGQYKWECEEQVGLTEPYYCRNLWLLAFPNCTINKRATDRPLDKAQTLWLPCLDSLSDLESFLPVFLLHSEGNCNSSLSLTLSGLGDCLSVSTVLTFSFALPSLLLVFWPFFFFLQNLLAITSCISRTTLEVCVVHVDKANKYMWERGWMVNSKQVGPT